MFSFIEQFENIWKNNKEETAVAYWDEHDNYSMITYENVYNISEYLKEAISNVMEEKHVCVALYMEQNPFIPSLIISLMKCEVCFIFLNPYASQNNLKIIQEAKIKWIISDVNETNMGFLLENATKENNIEIPNFPKTIFSIWNSNCIIEHDNSLENICFVVFTSGSTGEPKFVKVQHDCIMSNIFSFMKIFELTQKDVIYFGTSLTFDPSMVELFLGLSSGSSLLIAPPEVRCNSSRLLNLLFPQEEKHFYRGITVLQTVPSLFLQWSRKDIEYILQKSRCRIIAFGGEKFPETILQIERNKHLKIFNLYGITEVSCWASIYEVTDCDEKIALGVPLNDTILEVRNVIDGERIYDGEGELLIGSSNRICNINNEDDKLLNRPVFRSTGDIVKITHEAIYYMGRKNSVIKRFGNKINLLKMEEMVLKELNLQNSCIWMENKYKLVLFLVILEFNEITKRKIIDKLRVKLLHILPSGYFPDHIEIIPNFPLTTNGKTDKKFLETIYDNTSNRFKNKNSVELLKHLWVKYLGVCYDELQKYQNYNFFQLGGNSFLWVQFLTELQHLIHVDHSTELTVLLYEKTLKDCLNYISKFKIHKRLQNFEEHLSSKVHIIEETSIKEDSLDSNEINLELSWRYNMKACIDSTPQIINNRENGFFVAVGSFSNIFAVLNGENGDAIFEIVLPDTIESACCVSPSNAHVYVGCFDGKMYCIDVMKGFIRWEYQTGDRIKCTPCLCLQNSAIVFGSYDKLVHCITREGGNLIWKTAVNESITSNPILHKENVYIATIFGTCLCLKESNGEILWKYIVGAPIFGSPCIIRNNIAWPVVNGTVIGFSLTAGEEKWKFKTGNDGYIFSSLIQYQGFMIFGCHDHHIYCLEINDDVNTVCTLQYKVSLEFAINATPQIMDFQQHKSYIIAANNEGNIVVIDFNTGTIIISKKLPNALFSSPVIKNNRIYIGCRDNYLYCLEIIKRK